ncbi:aminoglycoside phosphotransferase family protein [Dehalococcoides mccartyi]|nr:aminoglycoside phosphotransferase family protein [Dehalococcoides mccartyi]
MEINSSLVKTLVANQFPQWRELLVTEVLPNGWDNRTFRLGDDMSVRLPSAERYAAQVDKEQRWLPLLAKRLPLPIPTPIAIGIPGSGYPWEWSIYGWLPGETAAADRTLKMPAFALSLSSFLTSLHRIATTGAPAPGDHNFYRGGDLSVYDGQTRKALEILDDDSSLDIVKITEVWDKALDSSWNNPPVWIHGDVSSENLLVRDGELSGVIDFGGLAVGDPACDLVIAWTMFDVDSRQIFRQALDMDDATWERGRGWALWKSLIILSGISESNAAEAQACRNTLNEILLHHSEAR